ncbi:MAG: signal transduction histidine kinase [Cellvibrionaceae bacterium]|jgi:signal transduction histidine kinase
MKDALQSLHQATLLVANRGPLAQVLQQIVDVARDLLDAQYAALGVPNDKNLLDAFIYSGISAEEVALMKHLPRGYGLLGAIIREHKTIRLEKISDDERSVGFPANHPPMDNFLGIPVVGGGKTLGNLYLCNKIGGSSFTAEDEELAQMFAAHVAIAIQNARLDEEVQRLVVLDERTRIGMDLHDGIIQSIFAVGLLLENTRLSLHDDPEEAPKLIDQSIEGLNDAIRDIRNFILDLRPHRYDGDIIASINRLAQEFQANSMVEISLKIPLKGMKNLPPRIGRTLFLTAQNALANIARHAKATHTIIKITRSERKVCISIKDDGVGFEPELKQNTIGHGLRNMQMRAEEFNGKLKIQSAPGQGTQIELSLPL